MIGNKLITGIIFFAVINISCLIPEKKLPEDTYLTSSLEKRMQAILDEGIKRYDARGVSVAVIFPDKKVWKGVSGISYDTVTIRPDMLFAIGSVTKNIVAALTLRLAEEGELSLEDPIKKWLPIYPHIDGTITIRQLLNHTSGIYMFWENQKLWDDLIADRERFWTPEEVLAYIKEPHYKPGENWRYSNTNYLLLAMIIEKVTGSSLSAEFRKYLWDPLGIYNAYVSQEDDMPMDQLAHVYGDNWIFGNEETDLTYYPRTSHESIGWGSSGIFTTAEDLAQWCFYLFEGEVLADESLKEMLQFVEFWPVSNMEAYGLGVQRYDKEFSAGKYAIGHGGGNIGTTTYMIYFPEYHISMVVMVNAFPSRASGFISKRLIRVVLREQNALGLFPYIRFFPRGLLIILIVTSLTLIIYSFFKKKLKKV